MRSRALLLTAAFTMSLSPVSLAGQAPPLSKVDRQRGQDMLRQVRQDIEQNYFDSTFKGIDLAARFSAAEQLVARATTLNEMYAVLTDAVTALDDSHTVFVPPSRSSRVDYGWRMAMVGDAPLVVSVTAGSDAAAKGMTPGDRVLSLNRFIPARANLWQISLLYNVVRPQAQQRVVLRKPDGRELALDVASKVTNHRFAQFSDLVIEAEKSEAALKHRTEAVGADILVWKMPTFGESRPVEDAIRKARKYKTLVIDLRGNGGGAVSTLGTMVSWFFDHEVVVATEKTRKKEVVERTKARKDPFTGKVIVLVNSDSGSAAEVFARVMQIEKRATVIGDRTAGAVMTGRMFGHAIGTDGLVFFATMVTVGDVRMSDGSTLEKVGVAPDEIALPAAADLASGRDPVLARALAIAGATVTPEEAGRIFK